MDVLTSLFRIARRTRTLAVISTLGLLSLSGQAFAWSCDYIGAQSQTLTMPSSVVVPRDTQLGNGAPLSGWYYTAQATSRNCTTSGGTANLSIGVSYQTNGLTPVSGLSITNESGNPAQVYYTNVAGVGIAFQAYGWQCGGYSPWGNVLNYNSIWWGCISSTTGTFSNWLAGRLAARLVKIGNISPGRVTLSRPVKQIAIIDAQWDWGGDNTRRWFDFTPTDIVIAACVTPDVTVDLGTHAPSEFSGVGSSSSPVSFNVNVNNCPAGINTVLYGFNYPSESLRNNAAQGIINLDSSSTASGVAVQLLDNNGTTPKAMDTWFTLPGYNPGAGGNYTIPLKARYVQTGGTVTAGPANTSILLAMNYR